MVITLTTVLLALLLFNNRQYVFHTSLYEDSDWAADSLLVREAKHGFLVHGHYSRWAFYHPGPALIDTLAAGEALFYDTLHLVPTPYNGQIIALGFVMTLCFSLALAIFARRLGSGGGGMLFFLPLALFLALWHYGAANGRALFLDSWPANPPVLVLLCFLVAVASTVSGGGWELPVVVAAGGWLVHNYVAMPLFVVPLTLLAYAGLLIVCWRRPADLPGNSRPRGGFLLGGWRAFPRAHWVAAALLALFMLPLLVDGLHGSDSNLAHILDHVRSYHEPLKKWSRSLCYFLTYGTYSVYQPGTQAFDHYTTAGMVAFAELHWRVYSLWIIALVTAPVLFLFAARRWETGASAERGLPWKRFVLGFYVTGFAALVITVYWGMKMDGAMYYFNAYFNYSIYFCAALAFAGAVSVALMAWTDFSPRAQHLRPAIAAVLWLGVAGAAVFQAGQFRLGDNFSTPGEYLQARTVERAAATLPKDAVCYLDCHPWEGWPIAIAVALELERLGHKVRVNDNWEVMFGNERTIQHEPLGVGAPLFHWVVVPMRDDPARLSAWPLWFDYALDMETPPSINPAGQSITFSKDGNFQDFTLFGWPPTGGDYTWSDQRTGLLVFRPLPLPAGAAAGVDLLISAWSFTTPNHLEKQRVEVQFNGETLAVLPLPFFDPLNPPLQVWISTATWQRAVAEGSVRLRFVFPDAKSPQALGLSADTRPLGGGFRRLDFQLASVYPGMLSTPAPASQPAGQ